jgi:hypothetical protein
MSEVLVGTAYWLAQLRYEQFTQGVGVVEQQIARLRALTSKPLQLPVGVGGSAGAGGKSPTADEVKYAQAIARTAEAQARLANATNKRAESDARAARAISQTALVDQRRATEAARTSAADDRAAQAALRRQQAETRAAQQAAQQQRAPASPIAAASGGFGTPAADAVKSNLLGLLGPTALVAGGFATLGKAMDLSEEGFRLKASLDTVNASLTSQLRSIRDSSKVFAEGRTFADRYQITQAELSSTLQSSIPILRNTTSTTTELLTQISLLQATAPDKPISEAARALRELSTGDVTTIKELFNVSAKDALAMKNAIAAGGDPVKVLAKYLADSGASMELLNQRTTGATGKMNELAVETERFKLALAGQSGGPGLEILNARIDLTRGGTRLLAGEWDAFGRSVTANIAQGQTGLLSFLNILQPFAQQTQISIGAADVAVEQLRARTEQGAGAFNAASAAAQFYAAGVGRAGDAASVAAGQIAALTGALGTAPETRHIGGTGNTTGRLAGVFGGGAGGAFQRVDAQQQALQASRDALALARATTSAQKIAIFERQLARQTTEEGRNRIQAQIEGERRGGAGRVNAAQSTALQLNQVEQNSGLQLLKTQRENLERLRDQAEDFDVRRGRAQEDFAEKRRKLLTSGYKAQSAQVKALDAEFAKDQRRELEDFDRQRRRTLRNNAEGVGDIGARADLRQSQIGDRAALRGVRTAGGVDLGVAPPTLTGAAPAGGQARQQQIAQLNLTAQLNLDGKAVALATWPTIEVLVDEELSVSLAQIGVPGSGQQAVGGVG